MFIWNGIAIMYNGRQLRCDFGEIVLHTNRKVSTELLVISRQGKENKMKHIELGIDGNCAFALSREDLQSGEAEFIEIDYNSYSDKLVAELVAMKTALKKLRTRLNQPNLRWYHGTSSPYGN
jgi:predicted nucleic acid-binding protein